MALVSKSPTIKHPKGKMSKPQGTAVGSGSRPTKSKMPIETSAPKDPHGLGRRTGNALK